MIKYISREETLGEMGQESFSLFSENGESEGKNDSNELQQYQLHCEVIPYYVEGTMPKVSIYYLI